MFLVRLPYHIEAASRNEEANTGRTPGIGPEF